MAEPAAPPNQKRRRFEDIDGDNVGLLLTWIENEEKKRKCSRQAAEKLRSYLQNYDEGAGSLFPSSEENFAEELEIEGEMDKEFASKAYNLVTTYFSPTTDEKSRMDPICPKTPQNTAKEIERAMNREYSVEGSENISF